MKLPAHQKHKDRVLVVSPAAAKIQQWLSEKVAELFTISIHTSTDAITGMKSVKKYFPVLIMVDDRLPDMNGMSFSSIVKDTLEGSESTIYLFNVEKLLQNTKANYFLPVLTSEDELKNILMLQVKAFFEARYIQTIHADEYAAQKAMQYDSLPDSIDTSRFAVSSVFSPFDQLSGDGFDYWVGEEGNGLYGFLFDCTGYGPLSYPLVGNIRSDLRKSCKFLQAGMFGSLSEALEDVNFDIFNTSPNNDPSPTAAIIFHLDFERNVLSYCTAGIPGFFIRRTGANHFEKKSARNYLLGMIPDAKFDEEKISLKGVDELMFSSDGFSELLYHRNNLPKPLAKHDDVSAITIQLKRNS